nr:hypothetical protein [Pseudogulbenkiania sp. NH8B]
MGKLSEGRVMVGTGKILPLDQTVDFGLAHGYARFDRVDIHQLVLYGRLFIKTPSLWPALVIGVVIAWHARNGRVVAMQPMVERAGEVAPALSQGGYAGERLALY